MIPGGAVRALLAGDAHRALRRVKVFGRHSAAFAYASSKLAVTRWARRTAITPEWAGAGIRVNVIAPGIVATPLLDEQIATGAKAAVEGLPVPVGGRGTPEGIAAWVAFMLSPAADFVCGAVVVVDGGSEAWYRTNDWPRSTGLPGAVRYLRRTRAWRERVHVG